MTIDTKGFEPKELTQDELAVMRADVADRIIVARVGLLLRHPFFGNMATRLKVQHCDDWCPTAATDGKHLFYNTQFFNALSNKDNASLTEPSDIFTINFRASSVTFLFSLSLIFFIKSNSSEDLILERSKR